MPLDDREQRILAEIERQLYAEDPALVHAVKNIDRVGRFGVRLPAVGMVVGLVITIATFTLSSYVAIAGFVLLVISATALVHGLRSRAERGRERRERRWPRPFRRR
ncbi:MAG: hypothetical protein KatS3mg011_1811 [Acidimicrobiia bacterium]|nr:MAG: hypothetical protein KatS3mg011_1811 [Acidimicrobiia bacterium]